LAISFEELNKPDDPSDAGRPPTFNPGWSHAIEAENAHHRTPLRLIDKTEEGLETQISGRQDTLDAFFDGLRDLEDTERPRPQKLLEELNTLAGMQLRLTNEQLRALGEDPEDVKEDIWALISANLTALYASRVIAAVQNRIGEPLGEKFEISSWDDAAEKILEAARNALQHRRERLVGENGQIARDIDHLMPRELNDTTKLNLLLSLSQAARTIFDQKTHRQVKQVFSRFGYVFLVSQLLEGREVDQVVEDVMEHLEQAEEALRFAWGQSEYVRLAANAQRLADFGPAAKWLSGRNSQRNSPPWRV
jgi:hypothetical protein